MNETEKKIAAAHPLSFCPRGFVETGYNGSRKMAELLREVFGETVTIVTCTTPGPNEYGYTVHWYPRGF